MKALIAVTHLLGTGHLSRALTLGRALLRRVIRSVLHQVALPPHS